MTKSISQDKLEKLEKLAKWLDSKFIIPGTEFTIGLDSILGLIPAVGDTVTLTSTAYFYSIAHSYDLPWHIKVRILWNGFIDWAIGIIPFFGDIFDIGWKSNLKNLELIKSHLEKHSR